MTEEATQHRDPAEVAVVADGDAVFLRLDGESFEFRRREAAALRDELAEALVCRHEFVHTAGEHREDDSYVVERRGADSAGHRKVFDGFDRCRRLYERLPAEFTAEDVGRTGLTGGRRHMLVWHYAEHPAFDCELAARQPLTVRKHDAPCEQGATGEQGVTPAD